MMNKKLVKSTAIYAISDGISKGLSFITLPFVSFYLIPAELGVAANFDVLQNILCLLAWQAVVYSLPYFYYDRTRQEFAKLITSLIVTIVLSCIFLAGVIFLTFGYIQKYIHLSLTLQFLSVVTAFSFLITNIGLVLYRIEEKAKCFMVLQILQTILNLSLLILLVIGLKMGALGKILTTACTFLVFSVVHLFLLWKRGYLVPKISLDSMRELLHFGIPLLPHSLSFWLKSGMDKVLLTTYCGLTINGLYSMAMSFGAAYSIFFTAFEGAYVPYLQKRLNAMNDINRDSEKRSIVILSYRIMVCFSILSILAILVCWLAMKFLLSDKYLPSFQFVPWIILSQTIFSIYGLVVEFPYTVKKTFGLGIITFLGSLVQFLLSYTLISNYGSNGIKISLIIGNTIIAIAVWWYSNKVFPMPWFLKK